MGKWIMRWDIIFILNDNFTTCPGIKETSLYKGSIDTSSLQLVELKYPYKADKYKY